MYFPKLVQLQQATDALVGWVTAWQLSISVNKCCMLNVGRYSTCLSTDGVALGLPVVTSTRDLDDLVTHDLSPTLHINIVVAKAHKRSAARLFIVPLHVEMLTYLFVLILHTFDLFIIIIIKEQIKVT